MGIGAGGGDHSPTILTGENPSLFNKYVLHEENV